MARVFHLCWFISNSFLKVMDFTIWCGFHNFLYLSSSLIKPILNTWISSWSVADISEVSVLCNDNDIHQSSSMIAICKSLWNTSTLRQVFFYIKYRSSNTLQHLCTEYRFIEEAYIFKNLNLLHSICWKTTCMIYLLCILKQIGKTIDN